MCACVVIIVINWLQLLFAYNNWMDPSYRVELSQFHSISLSLTYVISLILLLFISLSLTLSLSECPYMRKLDSQLSADGQLEGGRGRTT